MFERKSLELKYIFERGLVSKCHIIIPFLALTPGSLKYKHGLQLAPWAPCLVARRLEAVDLVLVVESRAGHLARINHHHFLVHQPDRRVVENKLSNRDCS